jgi:hypothetical protein
MFGQLPSPPPPALGNLDAELGQDIVGTIDPHLIELIKQPEHCGVDAFRRLQGPQLVPPPLLPLGGRHRCITYGRSANHAV